MPSPTISQVHLNAPMSELSIMYFQEAEELVSDDMFPLVPVDKRTDIYYEYDKGEMFRSDAQERAPGSPAARRGWKTSNTTYRCRRYSIAIPIDDDTDANADDVFDLHQDSTFIASHDLGIKRDLVWATNFFATSLWTTDDAGVASGPTGTQFLQFDASSATPIESIRARKTTIHTLTAKMPNVVGLGREVHDVLIDHSDVTGRMADDEPKIANEMTLAKILGFEKWKVLDTVRSTAKEGQTAVMARLFGKSLLMAYTPNKAGKRIPSAGYTFSFSKFDRKRAGQGADVKIWRDENIESDVVEGSLYFDHKLVGADLGAFMTTAVA